ncbi:uncharacterized protein LOC143665440 isoform X1 [Tamandua tetradactyla]|uniref:uncharacterized protein LOC143665440 isoform X1 n=1 Tax=Tamandua tetradactyla TaxID=48850 RepID=UPI0040545A74
MKRKQKRKHLESTDSQKTDKTSRKKLKVTCAVQCEHKEMATTQGITNLCKDTSQSGCPLKTTNSACEEEDTPSVSEYFSCLSSLPMPSEAGITNLCKGTSQSGCRLKTTNSACEEEDTSSVSEYFSCVSSLLMPSGAGITNLCKRTSQSGFPLKTTNSACEERDTSSVSEYFSCVSSLPMPSGAECPDLTKESLEPGPSGLFQDNRHMEEKDSDSEYCASSADNLIHTECPDLTKESLEPGPSGLFQDNRQIAEKDSNSRYCASSADNLIHTKIWKFQEDTLQPGSVMVSAWTQTARENYSDSEYSSSACKITVNEEDRICQLQQGGLALGSSEMPQPQNSEQEDTSSPLPHVTLPFHPIRKTCMPSIHVTKEEKLMNIYYMRVQMKRGVAVLRDNTEKGVEPPLKKTKMEEMTCPEEIHTGATHSCVSTRELLTESESNLEVEAQEEREEADEAEIPALEESSRAKTPDWLVALDSGFRCMGCCRVFPSLEVLQEHVQHGVNEGFSCQAFHLALDLLKKKRKMEEK